MRVSACPRVRVFAYVDVYWCAFAHVDACANACACVCMRLDACLCVRMCVGAYALALAHM